MAHRSLWDDDLYYDLYSGMLCVRYSFSHYIVFNILMLKEIMVLPFTASAFFIKSELFASR